MQVCQPAAANSGGRGQRLTGKPVTEQRQSLPTRARRHSICAAWSRASKREHNPLRSPWSVEPERGTLGGGAFAGVVRKRIRVGTSGLVLCGMSRAVARLSLVPTSDDVLRRPRSGFSLLRPGMRRPAQCRTRRQETPCDRRHNGALTNILTIRLGEASGSCQNRRSTATNLGVSEGIRTPDIQDHNLAL
jgi:hypothetical protein